VGITKLREDGASSLKIGGILVYSQMVKLAEKMIRKASVEDIPAIGEMARVVFPSTYKKILSGEQIEYMMEMMYSEGSLLNQMTAEGDVFFICEGRGYVSFRHKGRTDDGIELFHLEKLYVMPDAQGTGLGRELFDTVVKEVGRLSERGARIELNVNRENRAVGFYEHLGMKKVRQGDFPIGKGFYMNDFIMAIDC